MCGWYYCSVAGKKHLYRWSCAMLLSSLMASFVSEGKTYSKPLWSTYLKWNSLLFSTVQPGKYLCGQAKSSGGRPQVQSGLQKIALPAGPKSGRNFLLLARLASIPTLSCHAPVLRCPDHICPYKALPAYCVATYAAVAKNQVQQEGWHLYTVGRCISWSV